MSDNRITRVSETDTNWRRWQMGALDSSVSEREATGKHAPAGDRERDARQREEEEQQQREELETLRRQTLEAARKEGYEAGYSQGLEEGRAAGLEEGRQQGEDQYLEEKRALLAPLASLAREFSDATRSLDDHVVEELAALAMATGRQLAGEALKARPNQVLNLVRKLLHEEPLLSGQPRLWLNPKDHEIVAGELGEELQAAGWQLQPDDELARGSCRVTSPSGELDATRESHWQDLVSRVRRPRRRRKAADEESQ